jgi:hypothetical protein
MGESEDLGVLRIPPANFRPDHHRRSIERHAYASGGDLRAPELVLNMPTMDMPAVVFHFPFIATNRVKESLKNSQDNCNYEVEKAREKTEEDDFGGSLRAAHGRRALF